MCPVTGVPIVTPVPGVLTRPDVGEVLTVTGVRIMFIGGRTLRHRTVVMSGSLGPCSGRAIETSS